MFKQAKQNRTSENIIFQIQEAILGGKLKVGDKLPSEKQLREAFQVSRGTLREALIALEQKGLITIKPGAKGGAVVCPMDTKWVSESLDLLLRYQKISLEELTEFRLEVEGLVAAKAAEKANKEHIEQLRALLKSMEDHLRYGVLRWDEIGELDKVFHLSLARITGNKIYESVLFTVYDNIKQYFGRFIPKDIMVFKNTCEELQEIINAIESKDVDKAKALLQAHIRRYYQKAEAYKQVED